MVSCQTLIFQINIQKELNKNDPKIDGELNHDGIEFPVQEIDFKKIEIKTVVLLIKLFVLMTNLL